MRHRYTLSFYEIAGRDWTIYPLENECVCERESSLPAIHNQEPHFSPFRSIRASFWLFRGANTHGHYKRLIINCPKERKKEEEKPVVSPKTETLRT